MDATAAYPPQQTRSNLAGIGWMLVTGLFFVAVNGTVRWIGGKRHGALLLPLLI